MTSIDNCPNDRFIKYALGACRMALLLGLALWIHNSSVVSPSVQEFVPYAMTGFLASVGNTNSVPFVPGLILLCGLLAHQLILQRDAVFLLLLVKTCLADLCASKIDTVQFQICYWLIVAVVLPCFVLFNILTPLGIGDDDVILFSPFWWGGLILFTIHFLTEWGDAHFTEWTFFRHRYSYDGLTLLYILFGLPWKRDTDVVGNELRLLPLELMFCLVYRVMGALVVLWRTDLPRAWKLVPRH